VEREKFLECVWIATDKGFGESEISKVKPSLQQPVEADKFVRR
jgi:hypothetical protein